MWRRTEGAAVLKLLLTVDFVFLLNIFNVSLDLLSSLFGHLSVPQPDACFLLPQQCCHYVFIKAFR